MEVPEFRWPTTPLTLESTSFCAAAAPCFGSAPSSSASSSNLTFLPPIVTPLAFRSSMAMRAPFSLSFPRCAMAPLVGATWPIFTTMSCALAAPASRITAAPTIAFSLTCMQNLQVVYVERRVCEFLNGRDNSSKISTFPPGILGATPRVCEGSAPEHATACKPWAKRVGTTLRSALTMTGEFLSYRFDDHVAQRRRELIAHLVHEGFAQARQRRRQRL